MTSQMIDGAVARRFVETLFGDAPSGSFIEVRFRRRGGMGQSFHPVDALDAKFQLAGEDRVEPLAQRVDVGRRERAPRDVAHVEGRGLFLGRARLDLIVVGRAGSDHA